MSGLSEQERALAEEVCPCDGSKHDPAWGIECDWSLRLVRAVLDSDEFRAIVARRVAVALEDLGLLADDFHERAQSHVLATDASRAYRDAWQTASRKLRAALAAATETGGEA